MIKSLFLACALLAQACAVGPSPKPTPQPEPPSPWDNPPPEARDAAPSSGCAAACQRLASLGCQESQPTAKGASCVDVCQNAEDSGVISLGPDCIVHADSCASAKACSFAVKK